MLALIAEKDDLAAEAGSLQEQVTALAATETGLRHQVLLPYLQMSSFQFHLFSIHSFYVPFHVPSALPDYFFL